jgi:hypothetical protein
VREITLAPVGRERPALTFSWPFNQRGLMDLVRAVQSEPPLRAQCRSQPGMESRRLYRRGPRALRRVPHPAQPRQSLDYSGAEIAAVANYVTARFGAKPSSVTPKQAAKLRKAT